MVYWGLLERGEALGRGKGHEGGGEGVNIRRRLPMDRPGKRVTGRERKEQKSNYKPQPERAGRSLPNGMWGERGVEKTGLEG